jgi:hypothetical protein
MSATREYAVIRASTDGEPFRYDCAIGKCWREYGEEFHDCAHFAAGEIDDHCPTQCPHFVPRELAEQVATA